ncbi:MAG: ribbon-helix-helix protein, CopG family [Thermoproteota archaeon]
MSISLPQSLLDRIDEYVRLLGFVGRSELVREAVRRFIESIGVEEDPDRQLHWIIVTITEHSQGYSVDQKVIEVVHAHQTLVKAFYHQLLRDGVCANIAVVEASVKEASSLLRELRRLRGVLRTWFVPVQV